MSAGKGDKPRHNLKKYAQNFDSIFRKRGRVAERFKASVLKTEDRNRSVGSNPTPSSKKINLTDNNS